MSNQVRADWCCMVCGLRPMVTPERKGVSVGYARLVCAECDVLLDPLTLIARVRRLEDRIEELERKV